MHRDNPFTPDVQIRRARWTHWQRHQDPRWQPFLALMAQRIEGIRSIWASLGWPQPGWGLPHAWEAVAQGSGCSIFEEDGRALLKEIDHRGRWIYAEAACFFADDPIYRLKAGAPILGNTRLPPDEAVLPQLPFRGLYVELPPVLRIDGWQGRPHPVEGVYLAESWSVPPHFFGRGQSTPRLMRDAHPAREVACLWIGKALGTYQSSAGTVEVDEPFLHSTLPVPLGRTPSEMDRLAAYLVQAIAEGATDQGLVRIPGRGPGGSEE